jgi:hypothetical protein
MGHILIHAARFAIWIVVFMAIVLAVIQFELDARRGLSAIGCQPSARIGCGICQSRRVANGWGFWPTADPHFSPRP